MNANTPSWRATATAAALTCRRHAVSLRDQRGTTLLSGLFLAIAATVFVALLLAVWPFTPDDTFITLRYAQNLARGHGPTFNPESFPVEGYTNFFWMLLLALPHRLGWNAVFSAKAAGVAAMIATGFVAALWTKDLLHCRGKKDSTPAAVAVLFFAVLPATAVHAVSGMETALFTLLLTLFLATLTRFGSDPSRQRAIGLGTVALLLGLTRPEGNLVVGVGVFLESLLLAPAARRLLTPWAVGIYLLGGAAYMLWRTSYYGLLLPLPFYVKVMSPARFAGAARVWTFCVHFGLRLGLLVALGFIGLPRALVPACGAAAALLLFFVLPAHIMSYDWRYLFPLLPFMSVLAAAGYANLQTWADRARLRLATTGVLVAVPLALSLSLVADAPRIISERTAYAAGLAHAHTALGNALRGMHLRQPSLLLAIGDSGAVPYYSEWRTIDTFGLNDVRIARSGAHDPEYVLAQHPDLVVLISAQPDQFEELLPWEVALYRRALSAGMVTLRTLEFDRGYYLWLMAPPDSEVAATLRVGRTTPN
jgi:arabinofuranosyltransferase